MSFNIRLCRLFGSDIHLHATFFLFALLFAAMNVSGKGWAALPLMAAYYLAGFLSVLIHEYGHIFVARLHGVDCRKITLHGLGGLAHLDGELAQPRAEFLVAFAGPLTSKILAVFFWCAAGLLPDGPLSEFLGNLAVINIVIAGFNMIPAYPLDGGQMLHAVLKAVFGGDIAAAVSGAISQLLGAGLVVAGIMYGLVNVAIIGGLLFILAPSSLGRGWLSRLKREKPAEIRRASRQPPTAD